MKRIKKIGIWTLAILVLLVLIAYLLPGSYKVERSIAIKSGTDMPYLLASNFNLWHLWAPWTKETDTTAVFTISGETGKAGSGWSWVGDEFGQGEMVISELIQGKVIRYNLAFDHGKYKSVGEFKFEQAGDSCIVTWIDQGELGLNPLSRYMGLLMNKMMGPDFEKGLAKMKIVAESRSEWPKIEETTWPPQVLLTIRDSAGPESYNKVLGRAFGELMGVTAAQKLQITGAPFAIYQRWDSVTMFSVMDIGIPVEKASNGSGRAVVNNFPEQKVVLAHYFGPYEKTAPVYYILDQYIKDAGLENAGGPWEIYITDPSVEKDTAKWETVIAFPVK
jgi:effector-binding domain-containing protein